MLLSSLFTHWLVSCFWSETKINTHEGQFSGMGFVVAWAGLGTAGEDTSGGWRGPHLPTLNSLYSMVSMAQETSNSASKQALVTDFMTTVVFISAPGFSLSLF